jgi:hypothetical protein
VSDSAHEQPKTRKAVVVSKRQEHPSGGASPAARLVSGLDGQYYLVTEVAEMLGKDPMTIRRAMYSKKVKAPSFEVKQGKMKVYLYTPEDIQELREHFSPKLHKR